MHWGSETEGRSLGALGKLWPNIAETNRDCSLELGVAKRWLVLGWLVWTFRVVTPVLSPCVVTRQQITFKHHPSWTMDDSEVIAEELHAPALDHVCGDVFSHEKFL